MALRERGSVRMDTVTVLLVWLAINTVILAASLIFISLMMGERRVEFSVLGTVILKAAALLVLVDLAAMVPVAGLVLMVVVYFAGLIVLFKLDPPVAFIVALVNSMVAHALFFLVGVATRGA
jgi:hypothetical protein